MKIVSGGQTGVDRGALDAALELQIDCGGWCPEGRRAEDGVIPDRYPVTELDSSEYSDRTRRNVEDSDGTLIIHFGELEGGTDYTVRCCERAHKPHLVIDLATHTERDAVSHIAAFIEERGIDVLNVAGPRASKRENAQSVTRQVLTVVLNG